VLRKPTLICLLIVGCVALLASIVGRPRAVFAQAIGGIEVSVTPYLWMAGPHATIKTPLPNAPTVKSDLSFLDVLGRLDGVPFMGSFEIRQGAYGFLGDFIHLPVGTNITTRNILFNGGSAELTASTGTALILYRPYADQSQFLDAGIGMRAWDYSTKLSLNGGLLRPVSTSPSAAWADALIAARYHRELGYGFGLTAYGDVGTGGANLDWQLIGTIDYTTNSWLTLRAGYRALSFNYQENNPNRGFNVQLRGPIIAGTIRF
jgi:hypothetical protein